MEPVNVVISYSHKDEIFKDELLEFLNPLKRSGEIKIWNDRAILVGDKWNEEIINAFDKCEMILFLISPSFLASDYINDVEIVKAIQNHKESKLRLVPIMIRNCDINSHIITGEKYKISDFQGLPKNLKPIVTWDPRDDGWMDVVNGLKPVINLIKKQRSY